MFSQFLLGRVLGGAEWVLYLLLALSITSIGLILERTWFYGKASKGLGEFRTKVRKAAEAGRWEKVKTDAEERVQRDGGDFVDMDSELVLAMVAYSIKTDLHPTAIVLEQLAQDAILRAKLQWDRNLVFLATTGSNAPFVGLFGTVLGIIKAFQSLSEQSATGVPGVTAGVAEALIATAIGILVAIPSIVAFNFFQRRIKSAVTSAEALKSFLIGQLLT